MEKHDRTDAVQARTAIAFAVAFALLLFVYELWKSETVPFNLKMFAISGYLAGLIAAFRTRQIVNFTGLVLMLTGFNYVWNESAISMIWKVASAIAIIAQFYTLGDYYTRTGNKDESLTDS